MSTTTTLNPLMPTVRAGKFLTFALGGEEYGLEILKVREIVGCADVTTVPCTPVYVKGVINLRGQVASVIDLRAKFGMATVDRTEESCLIVVEISHAGRKLHTGLLVDRVLEVLDIAPGDIDPTPSFGSDLRTDFILGMAKVNGSVTILLDIDQVLAGEEASDLARLHQDQRPGAALKAPQAGRTKETTL